MSGVRRTDDMHSIKTRAIVLQNANGSFPAYRSVLAVADNRGHVLPTKDLVVDSLVCASFSANFLGTTTTPVIQLNVTDLSAENMSVGNLKVTNLSINNLTIPCAPFMSLLNVNATSTNQLIYSYNTLLKYLDSIGIINIPKFPLTIILAASPGPINKLLVSISNGESWNYIDTVGRGFLDTTGGIIWGNAQWFAIGNIGASSAIIYTQQVYADNTVPTIWTRALPIAPYVFDGSGSDIMWNGQIYMAAFKQATHCIWTSSDGITWIPNPPTTPPITSANSVMWNGNVWMLLANNSSGSLVYTSPDGDNWTSRGLVGTMGAALSAAYDGTRWVVCGTRKIGGSSIYYTYGDSENWEWTGVGGDVFNKSATSIAWSGITFVAVGEDDVSSNIPIMYSQDGITWSRVTSSNIVDSSGDMFYKGTSVMWAIDTFVAVGSDGINGYSKPAYSSDGIAWLVSNENISPAYPNITAVSHNYNIVDQYPNPRNVVLC